MQEEDPLEWIDLSLLHINPQFHYTYSIHLKDDVLSL